MVLWGRRLATSVRTLSRYVIQTCKTGSGEQVGAATMQVMKWQGSHSVIRAWEVVAPSILATTKALRRFHASRTVPSFSVGLAVHLKHGVAPT